MRWNRPETGQPNIKREFLFLPVTIGSQTRWLETATIKYRYTIVDMWVFAHGKWEPVEFIDELEDLKRVKHHHYWVWNYIDEAYIFCQDCNVRLDERTGNKGVYNYIDCVDGELIPKKKS